MLKFLRIGIVIFTCFVMWFKPNSSIDFFRSLVILSMGYGYDYLSIRKRGQMKHDCYQVILGTIGATVSLMFFAVGLAGLSGGLIIKLEEVPILISSSDLMIMHVAFQLEWLLLALIIFPMLAGVEFFSEG